MDIQTVNPTTGKIINNYREMSDKDVNAIIDASHDAYLSWRDLSFTERASYVRKLADILEQRKLEFGKLITTEMGKPFAQSISEIEKCAKLCLHFADNAEEYLKPRSIKTEMKKSFVTHEPLGIVFGIMPWNFPFWQVFRFAIPTMMAGNGALLKHAQISTGTAIAIEESFVDAGFPENIFKTLIISNESAAKVMAHHHVCAVTFTGSVVAGRIIASEAGKALKKTVMELGGCDAYVILEDADLDHAATACMTSRMANSGQSCIAPKRLIVVDAVRDELIKLLQEKMKRYVMGDPLTESVTIGPLARKDLRDKLHDQVMQSKTEGAMVLEGGFIPDMEGFFYPPTLLVNVTKGMSAYDDELFGPIITVISASNEDEAIEIANSTSYGLGAGVFTQDLQRGEMIAAKKLQAGTCVVNTFVASDSRLPFGGIKNSGYGRELSQEGILSFVNTKTVNIMA